MFEVTHVAAEGDGLEIHTERVMMGWSCSFTSLCALIMIQKCFIGYREKHLSAIHSVHLIFPRLKSEKMVLLS